MRDSGGHPLKPPTRGPCPLVDPPFLPSPRRERRVAFSYQNRRKRDRSCKAGSGCNGVCAIMAAPLEAVRHSGYPAYLCSPALTHSKNRRLAQNYCAQHQMPISHSEILSWGVHPDLIGMAGARGCPPKYSLPPLRAPWRGGYRG